jgi:hypothetical protein
VIEITPSRFKLTPYKHQLEGVKRLLKHPVYGLFWQMRLGKTKCVIDAACTMFENNIIDAVVIECPAQVKDVWVDKERGEIKKHNFLSEIRGEDEVYTYHYNARNESMLEDLFFNFTRVFIVTSFEFLRQEDAQGNFPKMEALLQAIGQRRFWLVIDEATAVSNPKALQTKATFKLRQKASRVTELDGTPDGNSPLDLYSKFAILDKNILGYKSFWEFQRAHCETRRVVFKGKKPFNKIIGFTNLEYITEKTAPFCWYLEQKDALDMPEKVPSFFSVPLTPRTWSTYKQMRDDLIADLDSGRIVVTNAAARVLRLAQICAGFVGGVVDGEEVVERELSNESIDGVIAWLELRFAENLKFKAVVWCRHRNEITRLAAALRTTKKFHTEVAQRYGGCDENTALLHPDYSLYDGPVILVGQPSAGRFGVNYSKADTAIYLSQDYDRVTRKQSEDRIQAPNTRKTSLIVDVLVTGPDGQKTVTHDIAKVLETKEEISQRTVSRWKEVLREE